MENTLILFLTFAIKIRIIQINQKIRTHYQPVQGSDFYCLVRMAIQNFLKNPVISMVLRLSDNKFSCFLLHKTLYIQGDC